MRKMKTMKIQRAAHMRELNSLLRLMGKIRMLDGSGNRMIRLVTVSSSRMNLHWPLL